MNVFTAVPWDRGEVEVANCSEAKNWNSSEAKNWKIPRAEMRFPHISKMNAGWISYICLKLKLILVQLLLI